MTSNNEVTPVSSPMPSAARPTNNKANVVSPPQQLCITTTSASSLSASSLLIKGSRNMMVEILPPYEELKKPMNLKKILRNRKKLVNFDMNSDEDRHNTFLKEFCTRECPICQETEDTNFSTEDSTVDFIINFVTSTQHARYLFEYIEDLEQQYGNEEKDDEEEEDLSENERLKKSAVFDRKKNNEKNKRIISMVRGLIVFFNKIDIQQHTDIDWVAMCRNSRNNSSSSSSSSENPQPKFSFFYLLVFIKTIYHEYKVVNIPMLMALVWSVYTTKSSYYGDGMPLPKTFFSIFYYDKCMHIAAPQILNADLIKYQDLLNKCWEPKKPLVAKSRQRRRKNLSEQDSDAEKEDVNQLRAKAKVDRENRANKRAKNTDGSTQDNNFNDAGNDSVNDPNQLRAKAKEYRENRANQRANSSTQDNNLNDVNNRNINADIDKEEIPVRIIDLYNEEHRSVSDGIQNDINIMTRNFQLPLFASFFSQYIVITEVLLYVIGKSLIHTNFVVYDGEQIHSDTIKLDFWNTFQRQAKQDIRLRNVSLVDLKDFNPEYVVRNEDVTSATVDKYVRASNLVQNYENDHQDIYKRLFISLFNLDRILLTDSRLDAEALWSEFPRKYIVMTFDGYKKNTKGILKFGKAFVG